MAPLLHPVMVAARWCVVLVMLLAWSSSAGAQDQYGPQFQDPTGEGLILTPPDATSSRNPVAILDQAGQSLPGTGESSGISAAMSVMLVLTVITLAPSVMLMTTSFIRILIVLGLLRQAIGAAGVPPSQVRTALALFMTMTVMAPTAERIWTEAVVPYQQGDLDQYDELWQAGSQPLRDFMFAQLEATGNWSSLYMLLEYRGVDISSPETLTRSQVDTATLVTAFMLSELKTAFLMGFKVYLPFLVIDMVIASILISMSMMMLPPVLISLPFKLLLFVLVDGWTLVVGGLLYSFSPDLGDTVALMNDTLQHAVRPTLAGVVAEGNASRVLG
mgnify:CR=1 FL=1